MSIKQQTKNLSLFLEEDNLAYHLQLWVMSIARYLVAVYVVGQMAAEVVQPYLAQIGELFVYRTTRMGDSESVDMTDTIAMEKFN